VRQRAIQPAPWWAVVGMFVAALSVSVATNILAIRAEARARHEADRQWCSLITLEDDTNRLVPPTTELGKLKASIYASLRASRCP
jgi:hypothetical protein